MNHIFFTQPWQVYTVGALAVWIILTTLAAVAWANVHRAREERFTAYDTQQQRKRFEEKEW